MTASLSEPSFALTAPTYVPRRATAEYLDHDPYESIDEFGACVINVRISRAKQAYPCHNPLGDCQTGQIEPGEQYRREASLVDGRMCVTRVCLYCMDCSMDDENGWPP